MSSDAKPKETRGALNAAGLHFGIVASRFNSFITDRLLASALDALTNAGATPDQIEIIRVPGAFEIPVAALSLAKNGRFGTVICIGCILRGETPHFDYIAAEAARGIQLAQIETGVPMIFCVLTCDTLEQAIDRAGLKSGNKGYEAGLAAVEMACLMKALSSSPGGRAERRSE